MHGQKADSRVWWRLPRSDDIAWASWNDEFVAYHRPSGKTHFLNASSHFLLTELLGEPQSTSAIVARFCAVEADVDVDREISRDVLAILEHFEHLGLIERA